MIEVPRDPAGGEMYDGEKEYLRPAVNQPLRPAVRELIDAAAAGRIYDVMRLPEPRNTDSACSVQRGGLESGLHFRVDDEAGMDARESAQHREEQERSAERESDPASAAAPMNDGTGGRW